MRNLAPLNYANQAGTDEMLRKGILGDRNMFKIRTSPGIASFTKGAGASYVTDGGEAAGATAVTIGTGSGAITEGTAISIADDTSGISYVAADSATTTNLPLNGELKDAVATAKAVTLSSYTGNMAFHRRAIALATRPTKLPPGGDSATEARIVDAQRLIYHLSKPQPDGRTDLMLTPLELIDRLAALIPPPHTHRHRYHGVLAPNATLRVAVTALAREASNDAQQQRCQENKDTEDAVEALWRSPARYLWAMLLARIYESAPLACPQCGADMRIIAFVTDGVSVRRIVTHIGEPTDPPRITPARGPPAWDGETEQFPLLDPVAQSEPDFQFDQTVSW